MKRLVVCCDGTWNTPDKSDGGVPLATNVVKVAEATLPRDDAQHEQRLYYDPGVGTAGSALRRMFDGATGSGLSRNVEEAYRFLIHNFEAGDELFFFGFSRGAFTVRSLGGLVRKCGILRPEHASLVPRAYALYRSGSRATHPRAREATLFRRTYAVADTTRVRFIGVWDTVGTLGNPLLLNGLISRRYRFHDLDLSSTVDFAYQALAIDEKRRHFKAALWNQQRHAVGQTLEQVWFVGAHSSVGGGCPTTGLSDIALHWMIEKARACGLALKDPVMRPETGEAIRESRTGAYRFLPAFYRPIDLPKEGEATNETLHPSVLERRASEPTYRPRNLEEYLERHGPPSPDP